MASTTALDEETSKKVLRQVEFYFGDSNLPKDKFLMKTLSESEDGLVSLALLCAFSKMRSHLGLGDAKPDDIADDTVLAVADTLRTSVFLKVSEDGTRVGRTTELAKPEELIEQLDNRTVAASPFPYNVTRDDLESFFSHFAKVSSVWLPTHVSAKKVFCGTALVEFSTEEDARKILQQRLVYDGAELEVRAKKDFDAERKKQVHDVDNTQSNSDSKSSEKDFPKGVVIAIALKRKQFGSKQNGRNQSINVEVSTLKTDGDKSEGIVSLGTNKVPDNSNGVNQIAGKINGDSGPEGDVNEVKDEEKCSEVGEGKDGGKAVSEKPNAAGYKNNADVVLREDLKAVFEKFGTVKFVDFKMGADSGFIRFEDREAAQKAHAVALLSDEGGLIVKNYIATLEPVTGDAEKEYWKFRDHSKSKDNRGRGGKHHKGGKRDWSRGKDSQDGPSNKFQKVGHDETSELFFRDAEE
ncbi:hypothetical protein Dimus_010443 [Dionaea muscipula]